jgi:putative inorganic carbon (HCO3(-)) transporter
MLGWIFTQVMTYGGAVAAVFNPHIGLLVYIAFSILKPESLWSWSMSEGHYSRIVGVALLFGWVIRGMGQWQLGRSRGIVLAFIGYWVWSMLSALVAPDQKVAWTFVENLSKIVLPFLVGITVIDSARALKQLAWVIALAHGFLAYEFNLSYFEGWNRLMVMGHGGMDENSVSIAMVSAGGLAFFLGLSAQRWWAKTLMLGAVILIVHAVLFSFSRGGMVGLIVTAFIGFWLLPKKPAHYFTFALAVALSFRLAGTEVRQEFMTVFADERQRDWSAQSRIELWSDAWDSMLKRPIFGLGPDHFPLVAKEYGWPDGKEVHNLWLQIGAELGFPGLLFLLGFYSLCIVRLWPLLRKQEPGADPWFRDAARMVVVSLVGFSAAAFFVSLEGLEVPYYITLIGAGVLKLSSLSKESSQLSIASPYVMDPAQRSKSDFNSN